MTAKVLIAHGSIQLLKQAVHDLQSAGFDVVATPDGGDAFARFFEELPDVVVCSEALPSLCGANFVKMVRSQSPDTPVFLLVEPGHEVLDVDDVVVLPEPLDVDVIVQFVHGASAEAETEAPDEPEPEGPTGNVFILAALQRFQRHNNLLSALDAAGLKRMAKIATHQSYAPGQIVIREGDPGDSFYLLVEGQVRVTLAAKGDAEVARISPGGFFGEMAVLSEKPRSASVWSVGETTLLRFGRDAFLPTLDDYPIIREVISGVALKRTEENLWRTLFDAGEVEETISSLGEQPTQEPSEAQVAAAPASPPPAVAPAEGAPGAAETAPPADHPATVDSTPQAAPTAPAHAEAPAVDPGADPASEQDDGKVELDGDPTLQIRQSILPRDSTQRGSEDAMPAMPLSAMQPGSTANANVRLAAGIAIGVMLSVPGTLGLLRWQPGLIGLGGSSTPQTSTANASLASAQPNPADTRKPPPEARAPDGQPSVGKRLDLAEPNLAEEPPPTAQAAVATQNADGTAEPQTDPKPPPQSEEPNVRKEEPSLEAEPIVTKQGAKTESETPSQPIQSLSRQERRRVRAALMQEYGAGNFSAAADLGARLRASGKTDWEALFTTAQAERQAGRTRASIATYRAFAKLYASTVYADDALYWAARGLERLGDKAGARALYARVAKDDKSNRKKDARQRLAALGR